MAVLDKDWSQHVVSAEEVARGRAFQELRDSILQQADPQRGEQVVDLGAGTGLLSLPVAEQVEQVWAIDISPAMCEYLAAKAASAQLENLRTAVASAVSLPLVDNSADLVVSNYCFHHLSDEDKVGALEEVRRILVPGGRLVFGDMMFRPGLAERRDRRLVAHKVRALARKGPRGLLRLIKNGARFATASWEKPARPEWWQEALVKVGYDDVAVEVLPHEGGIASARKPHS
jgi:SAM-dependent methyltransferase